jgi:hypothetical protein
MRLDSIGPWGLLNLFKDHWLVSRQAIMVFFLCTICVALATPIFLGSDPSRIYSWMGPSRNAVGGLSAVGTLLLWLGMWRYWVRIDNRGKWMKRLWFIVLLVGFWWGSFLYYFLAYLPQRFPNSRAET